MASFTDLTQGEVDTGLFTFAHAYDGVAVVARHRVVRTQQRVAGEVGIVVIEAQIIKLRGGMAFVTRIGAKLSQVDIGVAAGAIAWCSGIDRDLFPSLRRQVAVATGDLRVSAREREGGFGSMVEMDLAEVTFAMTIGATSHVHALGELAPMHIAVARITAA